MKKMALSLMVALLAFTFNTNAAKLQFVFWTNGAPATSDAQTITYYTTSLKVGSIAGAEIRATVTNYKEVYGEQGYQMLINAQPSDFTIGYSTGVEQNWGLENGKSVITGTLVAGIKIILYKGIPVAKWGSNGCLNPLTVPAPPKNDPVDQDNYAGVPPANNNRQSGPNPGNVNNNNINNITDPSGMATLAVFKDGIATERASMNAHTLLLMAYQKSLPVNTPCNTCTPAAAPAQSVVYVQPSLVAQATPAMAYNQQQPQQQNYAQNNYVNGHLDVDVTQKARVVDWVGAIGEFAQGVGAIKQSFFPEPLDINLRGGNSAPIYGNTWVPTVYGTGFQGSNQMGNVIGTNAVNTSATTSVFNTGTGYNNGNWVTPAANPTTGGGLVRIGY